MATIKGIARLSGQSSGGLGLADLVAIWAVREKGRFGSADGVGVDERAGVGESF